ncbi:hypothetical protein HS041_17225 [Planomonospora sp. ID67723]|uniref:hypothetical protein n=1 Tax=Planomonospora sp. ID67723 TaxID=2738134 RepID=UPI0018C410BB|nr:hypothetical protein [Planomonospora sp. ID67723]MBG0829510.1 hypothetical protein [Planomonospora sp. ID67723]
MVGLLCGGLITLLLLNTVLAEGSFRESDLRKANNELAQQKEERKNANARKKMPGAIAEDAEQRNNQRPDWDSIHVIDPDGSPDGQAPVEQGAGAGAGR